MFYTVSFVPFLFHLLIIFCCAEHAKIAKNFVSVSLNKYGHRELRIAYHHVLVLETAAFWNQADDVILRQVTDGKRFVQSVFQNGKLVDCEYTKNSQSILFLIDEFLKEKHDSMKFKNTNVFHAYGSTTLSNKTGAFKPIYNKMMLGKFRTYVDVKKQAKLCHILYRVNFKHEFETMNKANDIFRNTSVNSSPGVQNDSRKSDFVDSDEHNVHSDYVNSDKSKNNHNVVGDLKHKTYSDLPPIRFKRDTSTSSGRSKRGLFSGWLIFPGTKWCGTGDIAENYDDLGYDESTDMCCRKHDHCPHLINRFSWKYNIFNYHFHTMSMCVCDNRFRRCLRKSTSPTAKMVGKIYFNVIGPQCFKLHREKTCKKRNWWGMCKKYKKERYASLKTQKPF